MKKTKTTPQTQNQNNALKALGAAIIATLLTLHIMFVLADLFLHNFWGARLTPWFDMDREYNFQTAASSLLLLTAASWAMVLAAKTRPKLQKIGWGFFGIFFAYLAIDEFFVVHEQLAEPVRNMLGIASGSPYFHAWVIPAMVVSVLIGIIALIIRGLHRQLAIFSNILIALFFFAFAIITMEMLGTYAYNNQTVYRLIMIPLEEGVEITMAVYFWLTFRALSLKKQSVHG